MNIQVTSIPSPHFTGMQGSVLGHIYRVTSEYIERDGLPFIYRMGELHFSRMRPEDWERELTKMKEGGIDIISSYLFWSHHEPTPGSFDFTGSNDLKRFIELCEKLGLTFFLRIGPWAHGEARLGGFPDWLIEKCASLRCCDPKYLQYVRRFFQAVYEEVKFCRNIIGIQVENECYNEKAYLEELYRMLHEIGFHAPLWSATGWGNAQLPQGLLSMSGAYPEAPWEGHTQKLSLASVFSFTASRTSGGIGTDMQTDIPENPGDYRGVYPFLTCELGGGNQSTYHRRPLISSDDIAALTVIRLGSGCNGLGYYMYHGGLNPVKTDSDGRLITSQESRESGYSNDCPCVSYDFQAPLGDCGQVRKSYFVLKDLLSFVACVQAELAPMPAFFPDPMPDPGDPLPLQVSVRSDGERGFLFFNNCVHAESLPAKKESVTVSLNSSVLEIPLEIPSGCSGIIPFGLKLGTKVCRWIKAMPIAIQENSVTFVRLPGIAPEICLSDGTVRDLRELSQLGGISLHLLPPADCTPTIGKPLPCTEAVPRLSFEVFSHIIPLNGQKLTDATHEYLVDIPENTPYIGISAVGNLGAAFSEEDKPVLLSDHFLDGDLWIVDVRGISRIRLKIQPLLPSDRGQIYFESDMKEGVEPPTVFALPERITV